MGTPHGGQPPGPKGRWLVGNSYEYDQDRIGFLRRNQTRYGDVFSFSPSTVVVSDPELIHEMLTRSNDVFLAEGQVLASRRDLAKAEQSIDDWMRARRLGWQGLTRSVIRAHGARVVEMFDTALRATAGEETDLLALVHDYNGRLVADFLFGSCPEEVLAATRLRSTLTTHFLKSGLTIPKWLPTPRVRRTVRAESNTDATIGAHVRHRRANLHRQPEDLLDLLLAEADPPLHDEQIVQLLDSTMLAVLGSPGAVLSWAILELARRPDVRQRIRDEASAVLAQSGSLLDDSRLPYTRAFVREVLRLYPPAWLMGRTVRRPYTLGGWSLRPGLQIMFSPYLVHRDPRWWSEPEVLRPERWLQRATPEARRAYIPFGAGPRICLGMHLSLYQLATASAHLATYYDVAVNDADPPASFDVVLVPIGLRARFVAVAPAYRTEEAS